MNPGIIPDAKERLGRASLAMGESPAKGLLAIRGLMHSEERLGRALSLPVMFTWAGAAFSLSGALAFLLGIYSGSLSLSCAGSAALLAAYFSWREPADCVAKCAAPLKTSFGAAVPLSYCLSSKGRMVRIRGAELQVASYSIRGNSASAEGIWRPPCPGKLPMPNVLAVVTDRHGLFEKETTCRPDGEMLVLPRKEHRMNLEKKVMKRQIGIRSSKILGGTDEFVSLREYREGDDVRGIDWKATARTGEYCVREMVGFRRDKVLIIADMGKKPLDGNFAGRLVEDALEIGMNHLKLRDSVGLLVSGEKTDLLLLSSSQAQFSLMGYAFAKHNFSGEFNLLSAAKFASSRCPRGMKIYVLTNALDAKGMVSGSEYLASAGHKVRVLSYFEPSFSPRRDAVSLAAEQCANEEADELVLKLKKAGAKMSLVRKEDELGRIS